MKLKPVWIIDLTDQKEVEHKLNEYLSSYGDGKKWFHYSHYSDLGLDNTFSDLEILKEKYIEIADNVGSILLKPKPDPYRSPLLNTEIFDVNIIKNSVSNKLPAIVSLDVFVIGDDYIDKPIIGGALAKEIKFFTKVSDISTSKILGDEPKV